MDGIDLLLLAGASLVALFAFFPQRLAEVGLLVFDTLPVDNARVSQGFKAGVHSAIDFACPVGSTLFCVAPGTVVQVHDDPFGASGRFVIVKGRDQFSTVAWSYSHMEQVDVVEGQDLGPGDLVGRSGNTGESTGPHLHFAVLSFPGFSFLDPTPFLPLGQGGNA